MAPVRPPFTPFVGSSSKLVTDKGSSVTCEAIVCDTRST